MTPSTLAKAGSEHANQAALFAWCAMATRWGVTAANCEASYKTADAAEGTMRSHDDNPIPQLAMLFAIPNGDQRGDGSQKGAMIAGMRLKAEGVRNGVPDIMLAIALGDEYGQFHSGLFVEMKKAEYRTRKNGGCSDEQLDWHKRLREQDYCVIVCYSWEEARDALLSYLGIAWHD